MKIAYFDCSSGISGDMCLGAIVNAGVPIKLLENELNKIPIRGYRLLAKQVKRSGLAATKVDVKQQIAVRSRYSETKKWSGIEKLIRNSRLPQEIKQKGLNVFKRIFQAETKVHGESINSSHLHELGDIDCIIDIFGTLIGLDSLGIQEVYSSPLNLGSGFIETKKGIFPIPAPATSEILKKVPVYSRGAHCELTTPTGAAIIKELSKDFRKMPYMEIEKVGIGAGDRHLKGWPNILRLFIGKLHSVETNKNGDKITIIETNIDDMSPQVYEYVIAKLFKSGALDVYLTNIIMKKGRPGIKLTVLCHKKKKEDLMGIILTETTTIGIRFYEVQRKALDRTMMMRHTGFGKVRVKSSRSRDGIKKIVPEYEDCKKIAKKQNIPLIDILKKIR